MIRSAIDAARSLVGLALIRAGAKLAGAPVEEPEVVAPQYLGEAVEPGDPMDVQSEASRRMVAEGMRRASKPVVEDPKPLAGSLQARFPNATQRRAVR